MIEPDPKYFDYAASAPPYAEALEMFQEVSAKYFGNPSSIHLSGSASQKKLDRLKNDFCDLLNFRDGRLLLCSSGTEANNTIIEDYIRRFPTGKILIAENVHDSIWYSRDLYAKRVDILKLNKSQQIDLDGLNKALKSDTNLVCISNVCNETGVELDMSHITDLCYNRDIRLLIDGVQAIGHIPVSMDTIPCDYYTFAAHKFGGPRGCGGLLFRGDGFAPLLHGGKQEWQLRAGTENPGGLAGSIEALKISLESMSSEKNRLVELKSTLLNGLKDKIPNFIENSTEVSLPGFVSLSFPGHSGSEIVAAMTLNGFSISTGSACHANQVEPSRIILAMGRSKQEATGTIRISMGRNTTEQAVNDLSEALIEYIS